MGRRYADDLSSMNSLTLETQIGIHFSSNCYPPIPQIMVSVAVEAINNYNDENGNAIISLPAGVQFRNANTISSFDAIKTLRLNSWCDDRWEN